DTREVVVTEKDAVKLDPANVGTTQVWVAPLDFHIDAAFEAALLALLPPPTTRTPDGYPIA
ncbi:MAG TPA: tetraacyldisaccharide 4'-kinase, partial [Albitalea sp.]|nr:tetraacyldisaccharide 4'-kinase [Albitalea sp.]